MNEISYKLLLTSIALGTLVFGYFVFVEWF